jgi:hypothetical protein
MVDTKPLTAILDKFAIGRGYSSWKDFQEWKNLGEVDSNVEELASLAYSEAQKEIILTLEKNKNEITNNEAELNFGFGATLLWLKQKYGVKKNVDIPSTNTRRESIVIGHSTATITVDAKNLLNGNMKNTRV